MWYSNRAYGERRCDPIRSHNQAMEHARAFVLVALAGSTAAYQLSSHPQCHAPPRAAMPVAKYGQERGQPQGPSLDADRMSRSPGMVKNFYETDLSDFKRPHGQPAPVSVPEETVDAARQGKVGRYDVPTSGEVPMPGREKEYEAYQKQAETDAVAQEKATEMARFLQFKKAEENAWKAEALRSHGEPTNYEQDLGSAKGAQGRANARNLANAPPPSAVDGELLQRLERLEGDLMEARHRETSAMQRIVALEHVVGVAECEESLPGAPTAVAAAPTTAVGEAPAASPSTAPTDFALEQARQAEIAEIKAAAFVEGLKAAGFSLAEIKAHGCVEGLRAAGFSCAQFKGAGYTCDEAKTAGYAPDEIKTAGFSLAEIKAAGYVDGLRAVRRIRSLRSPPTNGPSSPPVAHASLPSRPQAGGLHVR